MIINDILLCILEEKLVKLICEEFQWLLQWVEKAKIKFKLFRLRGNKIQWPIQDSSDDGC